MSRLRHASIAAAGPLTSSSLALGSALAIVASGLAGAPEALRAQAPADVASASPGVDRYEVRIADLESRTIHVEAELAVPDGRVVMRRSVWSAHLPDGWATYVEGLEVLDEDGAWRPARYRGEASWLVPATDRARARLRYAVRLEHDRDAWPYGLKESTYVTSDFIHAVGMSLFVHSPSIADFEVAFDLPAGWAVVAPWDAVGTSPARFTGRGAWQLVHSVLAVGPFRPTRFDVGRGLVSLAIPAELREAEPRVRDVLRGVAREAGAAFGDPVGGRLSIVIGRGPGSGGAAFHRSFTMMTRGILSERDVTWKRTLAHELIHLWLGSNGIRTSGPADEWFKEGFTSYYAALLLARAGRLDARGFLAELESLLGMHRAEDGPPLTGAGAEERRWYDHLYGGGAVLAFCLDGRIRRDTRGERTLDDVMAALHGAFAEEGAPFASRRLAAFVRSATGLSLDDWIAEGVARPDGLHVEDCLANAGIEESRRLLGGPRLRPAPDRGLGLTLEALLAPRAAPPGS